MTLHTKDVMRAKCTARDEEGQECEYEGTLAALELHRHTFEMFGGRCEDYPCCGHTDGDGCQTLPEHTSDFYYRNPQFLHEPGSPEWYDAMEDMAREEDDEG